MLDCDQVKSSSRREQTLWVHDVRVRVYMCDHRTLMKKKHGHRLVSRACPSPACRLRRSPRPGNASSVLCGARLIIRRWHVRRVKHEDVDRSSEATRQRAHEGRNERFEWGLYFLNFHFWRGGGCGRWRDGCCTLFWDAVRAAV